MTYFRSFHMYGGTVPSHDPNSPLAYLGSVISTTLRAVLSLQLSVDPALNSVDAHSPFPLPVFSTS